MSATEPVHVRPLSFRSSMLRRPLRMQWSDMRLSVDPDGSFRGLESLGEERMLFGREQVWFYKVQAGVVVPAHRPDWEVKASPHRIRFSGRVFDAEVTQAIEFIQGRSPGFLRKVGVRNGSRAPLRLRLFELSDPTAARLPDREGTWGSLGVNAFNRTSHVAMDEVSDPPSARVVGAFPSPSAFYMTNSGQLAQELVSSGEPPEPTAGMSGQILILSSQELELAPGEQRDFTFASIYNPGKLEDALADFARLSQGQSAASRPPSILCSDPSVNDSSAWAMTALQGGSRSEPLDAYESLWVQSRFYPAEASKVVASARASLRKDGSLPHSLDLSKPGRLESAVFLYALARQLVEAQDKKLARPQYPLVKKLAAYLMAAAPAARLDPGLPQGWRRKLGSGYPTGEIPEVDLAAASALEEASRVARILSKPEAGKMLERSRLTVERVRKTLVDEKGYLSLCRDSGGVLRTDETVDMAVAAYRGEFSEPAEQAAAHRLLEKDFDTPYGPRCVPTSNMVYFNGTYGDGQLGGVWTRAALAHAALCYRTGLAGIGSLALAKVARLVADDSARLGGTPGCFPEWVDPDRKEVHGDWSDRVAAARFLECLLEGELGLATGASGPALAPPESSTLSWLMALGFWAGGVSSAFVGRGGGVHLFYSGPKVEGRGGSKFNRWERVELPQREVCAVTFYDPGQVVCLGNTAPTPVRLKVSFPPRAPDYARKLSAPLDEYDPAKRTWTKVATLRVSPSMSFECSLGPGTWKAYRTSTG